MVCEPIEMALQEPAVLYPTERDQTGLFFSVGQMTGWEMSGILGL